MSWRRVSNYLQFFCALAWLSLSSLAVASEYHGQVTLGGLPVPGATVTATQGDKKMVAVSDTQGVYSFPDLADGTWTIQVEMTGFATIKQDVAIAPNANAATWELKLLSLDQIRAAAKPVKVETVAPAVVAGTATTLPAAPTPAGGPAAAPTPAGKPAAASGKTADSKAAPAAAGAAAPPVEEASQNSADGLLINGSVNNAATSQFALSPAFGNSRNGGRSLYNGGLTLNLGNSALDARQYSPTGVETAKPQFNNVTLALGIQGPIRIPHFMPRGPNFAVNYQWTRNTTDNTLFGRMPTAADRTGDLSDMVNSLGQPLQIYSPTTGQLITGKVGPLSPQAVALLNLYPLPNVTSGTSGTQNNYQVAEVNSTHSDALQTRLDKSFGRNQLYGTFNMQSTRSSNANLFGFVDRTNTLGLNSNINFQHRFKQRLFMTASYQFSWQRTQLTPFFANVKNISGMAGITGNDQTPTNWGPPSLGFSTSLISGVNDGNSSSNRNETNTVNVNGSWNRTRHTIRFGADFRRQEFNYLAQQNPRGSFGFTGAATQAPGTTSTGTGSDFADFLLGIVDNTRIAYGNADKYFRQSGYDAFILDDWRARPDLTINAGIRWEYGAPTTELQGRIVNLIVAPGFTAAEPVKGFAPGSLPTSLIYPDKIGFAPNVGISWRPISGSSVLVKSGYGIGHNTSVYQSFANSDMGQQAPLSTSLNVPNSPTCPLTLAVGFNSCSAVSATIWGIDPNFRVGYAQSWYLSVQRDLPKSLQMTVTYNGIKGTRGVQQFLPNTYPTGGVNPNPCATCTSGYTYLTSNGNSTYEAGNILVRRRLRNGLTASLKYTYSKSLDDDAFLGSQGSGATAQNWLNLSAERALSTNDQRHLLNANIQYTTGMGIGGKTLMSGWKGLAYKEWTIVTNINVGSGLPETPTFISSLVGANCSSCIRPNYVAGQSIGKVGNGSYLNPAAFVAPALGQFGNARRDSITGPNQFSLNVSMQRSFRLKDHYSLNARLDSNNTLNHFVVTNYQTAISSSLYGTAAGFSQPRSVTANLSLRF
jgi:trimeric autotransporter adhesin